ncbi:MAG TPA: CHAT domain-containing protein, partial [Myxococcaceae bacterium]
QQRLKTLTREGDSLEADLAKRSAPLRALTALPPPAEIIDRVAASLPKDGALVELISYRDSPLVPKPGTPRAKIPSQLRYLALVLFPDASTHALDLGPAAPIDLAATRLRNALANRDASFQATAQELYRLAFHPLRPLLGTTQRILLSPDGQLGLVPFAALHDGRRFLVDSFDFTYLTSGRDLLPRPKEIVLASSVFVLADPDFTASPRAAPSASGDTPMPATWHSSSLERFFSPLRTGLASSAWTPLPGTRQEAEGIQRLLPQAQLFLGPEATKEQLLHLPTPGILHLATHGFFLEDAPTPTGARAVGHFGALGDNPLALHPRDPLLRSGLALAGARAPAPDASGPSTPPPDAALVTALEMAGLDLWGTQLVVLSACDTGRGDVQLGQGVSGLRRSLVVAGAETVVMSLWKVNDDSTHLLMNNYYRNLLAGQGRASALREAMRSLRASLPHPYHWAPFIALGSDAPLHAITPTARETPGG